MCVKTLAKRDEEKVREGFEQGKVHAQKVLEEENNLLKELLKKYRKAFRGRCPQQLEDLTETDVRKFTPFPSKKHLLIWFKHFVAGPTLYNGKTVPRYTTIEGYAGYQERYRTARRTQEDVDHPDMFGDGDLDGIPLEGARQKLEKMRHKLRKKKAVKQYHSAAAFKEPPLVSAESAQLELLICKMVVPGVGGAGVGKLRGLVNKGLTVEGNAGDTWALSAVA